MTLSWNEIKERAVKFSKEWENEFNEDAEAKSFMDDFFNVFGVPRRRVAGFEINVKKDGGKQGYIDLLWKGTILIEFKSRGKDLDKAHKQAKDYFPGLKDGELPKYILVSDFARFRLYDLEEDKTVEFELKDFVKNVQHFGFIAGYQKKIFTEQDPANIKAAELMAKLHDRLEEIGYTGHPLEVYLVRILFCLFAEDTTIFNKQQFQDYIEQRTNEDGSDLAAKLQELFQVLNTSPDKRFKNLDEQLAEFPYVNGKLFEEQLPTASFDSKMRQALLDCCYLDWSKISPAIFGSMFQGVMNKVERRNLGAHYTSEKNILKLIKPLFLDELWAEFESIKSNKNKLPEFHKKISSLKFLDPACGCGNFLVITYRELRLLELEILRAMNKGGQGFLNVSDIIWLDVDMMHGIEYEEFPARIAEVAMWLIDHQMNMQISNEFGQYYVRLPLRKSAKIIHGNALQTDWEALVSKSSLSFIIGNPPFLGKSNQNPEQKKDMDLVFKGVSGTGVLDYVSAWYVKAAELMQNTHIKTAFVSTNSITQGEQVGVLWQILFKKFHIKIHFAHRTFSWSNEAKGNAAVHVVIIGIGNFDIDKKMIYEYPTLNSEPQETIVNNINPYLVSGNDVFLPSRRTPLCGVPEILYGNKIVDGGNYLFTEEEKKEFVKNEPASKKFFKKILSGEEYINGKTRWVLYLKDVNPSELKSLPLVSERIHLVKEYRKQSTKKQTQETAKTPTLFAEPRQPETNFLLVPRTSSEHRKYIPLGFFSKDYIVNDSCTALPGATLYHFGVLTSEMHMSWVRHVCGRLKSDFRYSNSIVFNNFPWSETISDKLKEQISSAAQKVLDAREKFSDSSLADLYHSDSMPPELSKAHTELDKLVDKSYRNSSFESDMKRIEFLFELYEKYTADLFTKEKPKKTKKTAA